MTAVARLQRYLDHPDPLAQACNRIALVVASNQPFYPLYLLWIVGGDWWVGCWTFLSTPFFLAVPAVARRRPLLGRALLPATGIANGLLSAKAFGEASGVELFLLPCALIALLGFRKTEWPATAALLVATLLAAAMHGRYGAPLGRFDAAAYRHFVRLDAYSVAALCLVVLWSLIRARRTSASPRSPRSPPRR